MPSLLIQNAHAVATMDDAGSELSNAYILMRDGVIEAMGEGAAPAGLQVDEVIDAKHCVVIPGMVNTHHHMSQNLTRVLPAVQNAELFSWLKGLYPIWQNIRPEMIKTSALTAMAELLMSGCTTSSDHLYLYPNGSRLDDSIEAATQIGMRFHAMRGSMTVGESKGGLPPDSLVEKEDAVLNESQRLIESYHDTQRYAMLRIGLAPCSPFSVTNDLMLESAKLARSYTGQGVRLHTHLAENDHDIKYSLEVFGKSPTQYAEDLGWLGEDVWHAHCVKLDAHGINRFAATGTGIAHCPCSNMRLASGIAPIRKMLNAGVPVGLGVDGSSSNDAGHMLNEARQAMLLARVGKSLEAFGCDVAGSEMSARDALRIATRGGAKVLGRDDIGSIAVGMAADLALFRIDTLPMAGGAVHDAVAALLFCGSPHTEYTIVNGKVVVREGKLTTLDLMPHIERHNRFAVELVNKAGK